MTAEYTTRGAGCLSPGARGALGARECALSPFPYPTESEVFLEPCRRIEACLSGRSPTLAVTGLGVDATASRLHGVNGVSAPRTRVKSPLRQEGPQVASPPSIIRQFPGLIQR